MSKNVHVENPAFAQLCREAMDFAAVGFAVYRLDGTVLFINRSALEILDVQQRFPTPDHVIGNDISELVTEHHPGRRLREMLEDGQEVRALEAPFTTLAGNVKWVSCDAWLGVEDESGAQCIHLIVRDVTRQKETEEALRASQARYSALFEHNPIETVVVDDDGRVTGYNLAKRSSGDRLPQIGDVMYRDYAGKHSNDMRAELMACIHSGGMREFPEVLYGDRVLTIKMSPCQHGAIITCQDITQRTRAEQALRESEVRYRSLVEASYDAIFVETMDGRILDCNSAACHMYGHARDELIGLSVSTLVPEEDMARVPEVAAETLHKGHVRVEARGKRKNGDIFPTEVGTRLCHIGDQDVAVVFVRDITDRTTARNRLRYYRDFERLVLQISTRFVSVPAHQMHEEIRQALETIGQFAGVDRCYVSVTSEDGKQIAEGYEWCAPDISKEEDAILGAAVTEYRWMFDTLIRGEVLNIPRVADLPPEAAKDKALLEAQQIQSLINVPLTCERAFFGFMGFDMVRGERAWSEDTIASLQILGQVIGNAIARRRSEKRSQRLRSQVQHAQKLKSLGVLAGGIAHDFNNLLVGILGNAGLAASKVPPDSAEANYIHKIEASAQRAAELTNQMLAYSGRGVFVVRPVSLSKLALEMTQLLSASISKMAVLKFDFAPDLPLVEGDPAQLQQVIMNLITNASDALEDAPGVITIRTDTVHADRAYLDAAFLNDDLPEGHYVCLEVSDTGCGMHKEDQAKIFDPFFSTKFAGRGIGLAAVLGIIRAHKGTIKVYSEPGEGTTFRILLPARQDASAARASKGEGEDTTEDNVSGWHATGTVLVVDDEESVIEVANDILVRFGFSVVAARDGQEALHAFRTHQRDIVAVLLDLTLPVIGGEEVFAAIHAERPELPVILSSGYTEKDVSERFTEGQPSAFIHKPYRPLDLAATLRKALSETPRNTADE